jgi:hypothetical protein
MPIILVSHILITVLYCSQGSGERLESLCSHAYGDGEQENSDDGQSHAKPTRRLVRKDNG